MGTAVGMRTCHLPEQTCHILTSASADGAGCLSGGSAYIDWLPLEQGLWLPMLAQDGSPAVLRPQGLGGGGGPACGAQPASPPSPLLPGSPLPGAAGTGASQLSSTSAGMGGAEGASAGTSPGAAAAAAAGGAAGGTTSTWPSIRSSSMLLESLAPERKVSDWLRPGPPCCTLPLLPASCPPSAAAAAPGCTGCWPSDRERHSDLAPERSCCQRLPPAAARVLSSPLLPSPGLAAARVSGSRLGRGRRAGQLRGTRRLPVAGRKPGGAARLLVARSIEAAAGRSLPRPGRCSISVGEALAR